MDQFVHPCPNAPWLILLAAFFMGPSSVVVNAYQADGGMHWPTLGLGLVLEFCHYFFLVLTSCTLGLLGLLPLLTWIFAVYHGYLVMQKSK